MHSQIFSYTAPTSVPEGLTHKSVESMSLTLMWMAVPCSNQRGPITSYRLNYTYSNDTFTANNTLEVQSRYHKLTGLTPFTNYSVQFRVAAINAKGTGPYNDTVFTVVTLQDGELDHFLKCTHTYKLCSSWSSV